ARSILRAAPPRSPSAALEPRRASFSKRRWLHGGDQREFLPSLPSNEDWSRVFGSSPLCEPRSPRGDSRWVAFRSAQPTIWTSILAEPHDEFAPPHSITSSARASSIDGTSR